MAVVSAMPAAPALAQAPAAVPEAMPFDIPYGTPIDLDSAHKAIIAAVTEAKKHNWKMAVSVVTLSGFLVAETTMDGTRYASIEIAAAEARTAALFRRPSGAFQTAIDTGGFPANATIPGLSHAMASEGGFPIVVGGKLVGAIGASGDLHAGRGDGEGGAGGAGGEVGGLGRWVRFGTAGRLIGHSLGQRRPLQGR